MTNLRILCLSAACGIALVAFSQAREPWLTSRVSGSPEPPKAFAVERVYPHLRFDQPVELMPLADTGKMLVLEVGGRILTFDDDSQCAQVDLALDLTTRIDNFHRAFGIGVHPNFAVNREIYVVYAGGPVARADGTRLSRFRMLDSSPLQIDPDSEEILLTWASGGHNGSAIRFDQSGLLYFSAGDGARPFPPDEYNVSQDLSDLRATLCRIDVDRRDGQLGYAIPSDNPFVNLAGARPEIWAYGFRNPWRFSIDDSTGDILCGDVGWELWELVHRVQRGGNHGWSLFEGPQPIRSDLPPGPSPVISPLWAYPHTEGLSITGGFVYHGEMLPELQGSYLYGDYVTGLIWGLRYGESGADTNEVLAETGLQIITFAEGRRGEILVVSFDGGIYQLVRNSQAQLPSTFPRKLSDTGLFASTAKLIPERGVLPFQIVNPAWNVGATSQLLIAAPSQDSIVTSKQQRNWKYPVGTVFAKTLVRQADVHGTPTTRRMETQLLHYDGLSWQPYTYAWNDEQTDADLVDKAGMTLDYQFVNEQGVLESGKWRFHSRSECRACHSNQAGGAVSFTFANLKCTGPINSRESFSSGDQIDAFVQLGLLDRPPAGDSNPMVNPADESAPLEIRARSYLAANCAHCHCRGGGGTVALDLSLSNATSDIWAIDYPATQGDFTIQDAKVIAAGDPYRSILFYRLATSGPGHMPKLWSRDTDRLGLQVVHDWIVSLDTDASRRPTYDVRRAAESSNRLATENVESRQLATAQLEAELSVPDALRLAYSLQHADMPETERQHAARQLLQNADTLTRGLFERFLPAGERVVTLGDDIDAAEILKMAGDAATGRERFLHSRVQQCRNCHRLADQGQSVGPDLDGIAARRTRIELLESILEPAKKIEPLFATYVVVTADGQTLTGLKIDQNTQGIQLRSPDGKDHWIETDEIEHLQVQDTSIMPSGLAAAMTAQELADLLAFLNSLTDTTDGTADVSSAR